MAILIPTEEIQLKISHLNAVKDTVWFPTGEFPPGGFPPGGFPPLENLKVIIELLASK